MSKVELHDGGYRVQLTPAELGDVQHALRDSARWYRNHADGDEYFLSRARQLDELHAALDPGNAR